MITIYFAGQVSSVNIWFFDTKQKKIIIKECKLEQEN